MIDVADVQEGRVDGRDLKAMPHEAERDKEAGERVRDHRLSPVGNGDAAAGGEDVHRVEIVVVDTRSTRRGGEAAAPGDERIAPTGDAVQKLAVDFIAVGGHPRINGGEGLATALPGQRGPDIGVDEVVADEEQRLVAVAGESVGEAVAEVEPRGMATPLAVLPIGVPGDSGLGFGDWFYSDVKVKEEMIKIICGYGITFRLPDN